MVCHCSPVRQKNTTSAFVCSWFLSLSCHNQQKTSLSPAQKRSTTHTVNIPHFVGFLSARDESKDFIYKQALSERAHVLGVLVAITMAAVCMDRWKVGTGSDLKPSCILSSPLSSLLCCNAHPHLSHSSCIHLSFFPHTLKCKDYISSTFHLLTSSVPPSSLLSFGIYCCLTWAPGVCNS